MSFGTAIVTCLRKYATFSGRARRSEYWWFYLFWLLCVLGSVVVGFIVESALQGRTSRFAGILVVLLVFIILSVPRISAFVRRLHDRDMSGWWYWIALIPLGGIVLLVVGCMRGTRGANRFGPDPLADPSAVFD